MKCRSAFVATKDETIPVGDEEGRLFGLNIVEGLASFENGEIAKTRSNSIFDIIPGKGAQAIVYNFFTFLFVTVEFQEYPPMKIGQLVNEEVI
jgi:hypothetical protein